jgi:RHS repeat-associated protein
MTTPKHISTEYQGGLPQMIGQSPVQELTGKVYGARYYLSELSVWLSVDPLVSKMPSLSPYMAFKNNPVKYIDPDGRLPIVSSVVGFIKGAFAKRSNFEKKGTTRMGNALRSAWRHEKNAWKITGGLFATDKNKSFNGKVGQIFSRFTTELPQTVLGLVSSYGANLFGKMLDVNYKAGATVSKMRGLFGAFTLGSFVIGDRMISASPDNSLFQHEYGHYLQSQATGFLYLFKYAIPSLYSAAITNRNNYYGHMYSKPEQDANK